MALHGKKYRNARAQIDREQAYSPLQAVRLLKGWDGPRFDETVEAHVRLGLNVRHADQQLRGTLFLPHGLGKSVTVAVFAQGEKAKEAEDAGADVVGGDDLAARITEGWSEFDVAIATPDMMGTVGRLGRILGPQGKMPSPKAGTITFDISKAVSDIKAGKIEYRTDRTGIIHVTIGKKSFDERALVENYGAVLDEILRAKPAAAKGRYLRSITITSTMGPGVKIDTGRVRDLMEETAAV
jgi:large subunit ribosomal protein L1